MMLGRRLSRQLLVCTTLALASFAIAEDSLLIAVMGFVLNLSGWHFNERALHRKGRVPVGVARWLSTTLLTLAVLAAVVRGYLEHDVISSFLWLLASILLLKMWERRNVRDYGQMLTVSIFMTVGATLSDNSLLMGVTLLAQVPVVASGVMTYQLHAAAVRAGQTEVIISRRAVRSLRRIGWTGVVVGAALAVVAFVLVPRGIGLRRFGEFAQAGTGKATGFVDEVDLDQGGLISESQTRALDVQLMDGAGRLLTEDRSPLYLRGAVLDSYTGREWKRSRAEDDTRVVIRRLTPGAPHANLTQSRRLRVEPDPRTVLMQRIVTRQSSRGDTTLFCVWRPRRIEIPGGTDIEFDTVTARLVNKNEAGRFEYTITSYPSSAEDVLVDRNQRGRLPEQSSALTEEARRVVREQGIDPDPSTRPREDDVAAANALQSYVSSACRYTLDVPGAPLKKDPVEYFLFESKEGNCELFAAALAGMCRAVGIDARVIAGYLATEFDPQSSTYLVRQSHAHAWCEVNTADGIWETFDPTPASTFDTFRDRNASLTARIGAFFADMRDKWNQSVVTFDANSQQKLLGVPERDQPWYSEFAEAVSRGTDPEHVRMKNLLSRVLALTGYAAGGLIGFSLLVVVLRWLVSRIRRRGAGVALHRGWGAAGNGAARRLGRELDRAFDRLGASRAPWRPLLDHSRSLVGVPVEIRQTLIDASMQVYAAAFSSKVMDQRRIDQLIKEVRSTGK